MRLLCDTNILIYLAKGTLSKPAIDLLEDYANQVFYSPLSIVEVIIKQQSGKLNFQASVTDFVKSLQEGGMVPLDFKVSSALVLESLSHIHRDPFDRMLLAQALDRRIRFITTDQELAKYHEEIILVEHG